MPALTAPQFLIFFVVIIIGYGIYSVYMLKDKVHCTFRTRDKTVLHKTVKINAGKIVFCGAWYDLDVKRTTLRLIWQGIIPTWVRCLDYRWNSRYPLDPETFTNTADNPEDRAALDKTDDLKALMETQKSSLVKGTQKKGMLESLMPIILIAGFLIVGYLVYQLQGNVTQIGIQGNVTQQQLIDLQKTVDSKLK